MIRIRKNNKLAKVVIWRILSLLLGWVIAYSYMENVNKSLELTLVIGLTMTAVHYVFEKQWEKLED